MFLRSDWEKGQMEDKPMVLTGVRIILTPNGVLLLCG